MILRRLLSIGSLAISCAFARAEQPFAIVVVDEQTGRGVPLVELRTVNNIVHYTDSAGVVAFNEPGLMDREVWFGVKSHGYEYPADGFGYRGVRLRPTPGGSAEIKIKRLNVAERLYRVTGGGIYRDSVLLGRPVPLRDPVINGLVFGQDSVLSIVYRGKVHWFWGDTSRPAYPLGNFQVAGATSLLPSDGGLSPDVGVDLTYFVDENGFSREIAPVPGPGPTWVDGLMKFPAEDGGERLFAAYAKVKSDMSATQRGFMEYDDEAEQFRLVGQFPIDSPIVPGGAPFRHTVDGIEYYYHPRGFPFIRVAADPAAVTDINRYEAYTCLKKGSTQDAPALDRDESGELRYSWKRNTSSLYPQEQEKLLKDGTLKRAEASFRLYDVETGKPVIVHGMSVAWNEYRGRWVAIVLEIFGSSLLGELWVAEADTPLGPWCYARKIVTHDTYSFYNPRHHPFFDEASGRRIYFEGTYTATFSGATQHTPRYDYNQIMYRLDLTDPRVNMPVPVYRDADGRLGTKRDVSIGELPPEPVFLAPDRPMAGGLAIFESVQSDGSIMLSARVDAERSGSKPLFYARQTDEADSQATTDLLYEFTSPDGRRRTYVIEADGPVGWRRAGTPLCRVWCNPRKAEPLNTTTPEP